MKILTSRVIVTASLLAVTGLGAPILAHSSEGPIEVVNSERAATATHQADADQVIGLIARSKALQDKIPPFVDEASKAIEEHHGALPAAYSVRIAREMAEANAIRTSLFQYALLHRNALYRVDENMDDGERIDAILISMAAALMLFDNAQFMQKHFSGDHVLRSKLNEAYPESGVGKNYYEDSLLRANSLTYRTSMSDAIRFFQANQEAIAYHMVKAEQSLRTLYAFVEKSPARKRFGGDDAFRQIADQLGVLLQRSAIDSVEQVGKLKFLTSQVVGNTMGMVRWRAGKLKNDREFLSLMSEALQPGDILLEKTPFALTDKTIPGHFGHAAIYIGTTDQLRGIGALDLPIVQGRLEQIGSGHVVLEALRGGVVLNTLEHFMNIDDVAVLRPQKLPPEALRDSIGLALSNFGKRYDFNFDVNTTETIVCSELVYAAYPQIDFVTKQVFTSFTIAPDDIAKLAAGNPSDPLELKLFAHDGKLAYRKGGDISGMALYRELVGLKDGPRQALFVEE
jgi:uncharacterized protein YycO